MDSTTTRDLPAKPESVAETGLSAGFLADLVLKTIHVRGLMLGHEIADALKLPFLNVLDKVLATMRRERLIEVSGSAGIGESSYGYVISREGRSRARALMDRNRYVGPAPVSLEAYVQLVKGQSLNVQSITQGTLERALAHLVLAESTIDQLGPPILSGRSVFLFGNPGDGKTSIGLAVGTMFAGEIWIPYAVHVDEKIITVFDALHHRAVSDPNSRNALAADRRGLLRHLAREKTDGENSTDPSPEANGIDERWVRIHRPLIVSGGELTLKNLELVLDPTTKYYEAPQQLKANGGVFLVDDLGRQPVSARQILNRLIGPLDKCEDHLTLTGGTRITVPFDVLIIFATNLELREIADEVFLRRMRHKIHVPDPTWEEFAEIFRRAAAARNIAFCEEGLNYLVAEHYTKTRRGPRGVHPRDILDALMDVARYRGTVPSLSRELVDQACQVVFGNLPQR